MLLSHNGMSPNVEEASFIAPNCTISGNVTIGEGSSVLFYSVLRTEDGSITIGKNSCVEDLVMIHGPQRAPVTIGNNVTIGHAAIVHGATIEDNVLIGMGATIMDKCVIGEGSLIAAGTLLVGGTVIPPRSLVMGSPGKVVRQADERIAGMIDEAAEFYGATSRVFKKEVDSL